MTLIDDASGRQLPEYVRFEPAIFSQYDMFFVVSRIPLHVNTSAKVESELMATSNGRLCFSEDGKNWRQIELCAANRFKR
jgi:hypothetical protein